MQVLVKKSNAAGEVAAPPSKSYAHRLIIASFLSGGRCSVSNVSLSNDIKATLSCIKALGGDFTINNDTVTFSGNNSIPNQDKYILPCDESGSTLRFMIPIALTLLSGRTVVMQGTQKLLSRGLTVYENLFDKYGIQYTHGADSFVFCGTFNPDRIEIQGNLSSQYVTGLLFACSLVKRQTRIDILPPIESLPYINITVDVLKKFGCDIKMNGNSIDINGSVGYSATDTTVEGDYSNAAFLDALNCLSGSDVKVTGLNEKSIQGDKVYRDYFNQLRMGTPTLDISNCIDLGPILFGMAAMLNGAKFVGIRRLRDKESDRVLAMATELRKFNIFVDISPDYVIIRKNNFSIPKEMLCGHNDHRIVMTLFIILTSCGGVIDGFEAVNKSFPDFLERVKGLGVQYEIIKR